METKKRSHLTVADLPRSIVYKPLAIVMAIFLLPLLSWMDSGGGIARPFQAYAQAAPTITSLSPSSAQVGSAAFLLSVNGSGFTSSSTVLWNGSALATVFVSANELQASIGTNLIASAGTATVAVGSSTATFTITGIGVQGCASTTNSIIQSYCANGVVYFNDLTQFESDSVTAYLALHNLPQSDAHLIYDAGRSDLRTAVRGQMMTTLIGIFNTPAASRSAHQQALYNWMQGIVQANEISEYTNALNEFHRWQANPCAFGLDPTVANTYNLSYDGNPYCFPSETDVVPPQVPAEDYFTGFGLSKSYIAPAQKYPAMSLLVTGTGLNVGETVGITAAAVGVITAIATAVGAEVVAAMTASIAAFSLFGAAAGLASGATAGVLTVVSATTAEALGGIVGVLAAPIAIALLGIAIGITAGIELFQDEQQIQTISTDLTNGLNNATTNLPDLKGMAVDTSGIGFYKLQNSLVAQTLPEMPSAKALPAHVPGTDNAFNVGSNLSDTLTYADWNGNIWSLQTSGGWFVQTCANGPGSTCPQADSIVASIHYVDGAGVKWTAARLGSSFISVKAQPNATDVACPADINTGVTPNPTPATCSSYVSNAFSLVDGNGATQQVSLSVLTPPVFTSPMTLSFAPGIKSSQTIVASGNPKPNICANLTTSNLPPNFTLNAGGCGTGSFELDFDGNLNAPVGTYALNLTATGAGSPVPQTFTVNVAQVLNIVSPNSLNITAGFPITPFTVVATGNPTPKLSVDPSLGLGGLNFVDNGNGTATISGTYTAVTSGPISCLNANLQTGQTLPCGMIATNSTGSYEQQFTLNVAPASPATIAGCVPLGGCSPGAFFTAGVPNQVQLSATAPTGISAWQFDFAPPNWLTLTDNHNGTATLSGTPPFGTTGTISVQITAFAVAAIGAGSSFPITVVNTPVFTSPNTATFTVGTNSSFQISGTEGTISLTGAPPSGLSFMSGNPATLGGTAAVGTGGQYALTLIDNAGTNGSQTQSLTVNVNEAPRFTSLSTATMIVGTPGMFNVTTTGFPSVSNHKLPANPVAPTDPSQGDGMYFTVTGLPSDLSFSSLNAEGFASGTLTIQGRPSAGDIGSHQVQITAQNGVGTAAQQTLLLNVVNITGPAPASGTTCNGNYNGTFKGSITVKAGQNCAFYNGGVSGSISLNGGHLALTGTAVTGNLSVQGSSAFSIGPGTTIGGNLSIQSVASGSTASQICQTTVNGNVQVLANAVPIWIGSPQNACIGNTFMGNINISSNTAPISVFDNTVKETLSCSSNTSITGGRDTAQKMTGQCAAF